MSQIQDTSWLLESLGAKSLEMEKLQDLWAGYGSLWRLKLQGGPRTTAVTKRIHLGSSSRVDNKVSHQRKKRSYLVELEWYRNFAHLCDADCRVPALVASSVNDNAMTLVLEDLDGAGFSKRVVNPREEHLDMCLFWLAHFHALFLGAKPEGLWTLGTYWHLDTRREELAAMPGGDLKRRADKIHKKLNRARYKTLVHGDAKPENFCFSETGRVAAVDFQYVGAGCGMKDVAYLLWGCPSQMERELVNLYFDHLRVALGEKKPQAPFDEIEREWRDLYPYAKDDFERFLKGWLVSR